MASVFDEQPKYAEWSPLAVDPLQRDASSPEHAGVRYRILANTAGRFVSLADGDQKIPFFASCPQK